MLIAIVAIVVGLGLLVWSADWFVEGAAALARHFGLPALLIGMVIVGFGTSAPEMVVSAIASMEGNPGIALGNAYGSNIANIALILGLTALVSPIAVHSSVLRRELPVLAAVTGLAAWQVWDGNITRLDAAVLLLVFGALMAWSIREGLQQKTDDFGNEMERELGIHPMPPRRAAFRLLAGLVVLIASSRALVWGAVEVARGFGISDLVIGLTVVAVGTSLPELASSLAAARRNEHDIALGNVIGSNLFNTLAVVGIAGAIHPVAAAPEVFSRDILAMSVLTVSLFVMGYGFWSPRRINRWEGSLLLIAYIAYNTWLLRGAFAG
ncbi:MAG: calcium/sodium antiporter [Acidobacteria bacterium]|nr:calcium/sodium antiporter [Acidobacteriota bacterium]